MADAKKALKIKTGVVKRLYKEMGTYEIETEQHTRKIEQMEASNVDAYDIKKMVEVMNETRAMIPDSKKRLDKARAELEELLEVESDEAGSEEYKAAQEALASTAS